MVKEIKDLSYQDRLEILNLPSIKYRQIRADLIQTYKILHNIDNVNGEDFFSLSKIQNTRNNELKLYKKFAKSIPRNNFLSFRVINLWNSLQPDT